MITLLRLPSIAGIAILLSSITAGIAQPPQSASSASPATVQDLNQTASQTGLTALEYGRYGTAEDERLASSIRNAQSIRIMTPNGANLFEDKFKPDFTAFLAKPGVSMQVLFATADSEWYREETEITLGYQPGEPRYAANLGLVAADRGRLESFATAVSPDNLSHLHFKYFNTQFRLPIIIIDDKCYMTIRLSPNEGSQSVRMEFTQGFETSCSNHFDKMWSLSSDTPENSRLLTFLGLASWSRTELLALFAVISTIFAGIGTYLAIPAFQGLLRFERKQEMIAAEHREQDAVQESPPPIAKSAVRKGKRPGGR